MKTLAAWLVLIAALPASAADTLEGRWRLLAAEDVRADGTVAGYPWGHHPVGSIVVDNGSCFLQIMSSDVPSFAAGKPSGEQMTAALLSTYIAYAGSCTTDTAESSVTVKVAAAWRPEYVGTVQKRFFHFDNGKLIYGRPTPAAMRNGEAALTRRLTLERVSP